VTITTFLPSDERARATARAPSGPSVSVGGSDRQQGYPVAMQTGSRCVFVGRGRGREEVRVWEVSCQGCRGLGTLRLGGIVSGVLSVWGIQGGIGRRGGMNGVRGSHGDGGGGGGGDDDDDNDEDEDEDGDGVEVEDDEVERGLRMEGLTTWAPNKVHSNSSQSRVGDPPPPHLMRSRPAATQMP
jgi:hypothetical protein